MKARLRNTRYENEPLSPRMSRQRGWRFRDRVLWISLPKSPLLPCLLFRLVEFSETSFATNDER